MYTLLFFPFLLVQSFSSPPKHTISPELQILHMEKIWENNNILEIKESKVYLIFFTRLSTDVNETSVTKNIYSSGY